MRGKRDHLTEILRNGGHLSAHKGIGFRTRKLCKSELGKRGYGRGWSVVRINEAYMTVEAFSDGPWVEELAGLEATIDCAVM